MKSIDKNQNELSSIQLDNTSSGTLYVVATPIGNLEDITPRAIRVLSEVDYVLAEDTRHSGPLLRHYGINAQTFAFHEHNEVAQTPKIIEKLQAGESYAIISDAGTPLISDPGYGLVHAAKQANVRVEPIPGPCAIITALSASGLPTDEFLFAGFIPAKPQQRLNFLKGYQAYTGTLVYYESSHRIEKSMQACLEVFGDRQACMAREVTKKFETIKTAPLSELVDFITSDDNQKKGEFVVMIGGHAKSDGNTEGEALEQGLKVLLESLSVSQAVDIAVKLYGVKKNPTYKLAIKLSESMDD